MLSCRALAFSVENLLRKPICSPVDLTCQTPPSAKTITPPPPDATHEESPGSNTAQTTSPIPTPKQTPATTTTTTTAAATATTATTATTTLEKQGFVKRPLSPRIARLPKKRRRESDEGCGADGQTSLRGQKDAKMLHLCLLPTGNEELDVTDIPKPLVNPVEATALPRIPGHNSGSNRYLENGSDSAPGSPLDVKNIADRNNNNKNNSNYNKCDISAEFKNNANGCINNTQSIKVENKGIPQLPVFPRDLSHKQPGPTGSHPERYPSTREQRSPGLASQFCFCHGDMPCCGHPGVLSVPDCRGQGRDVLAELVHSDLWSSFHSLGTEMIITKSGRRMFPALKVRLSGLNPCKMYIVSLDFLQPDSRKYRYIYHSSQWVVSGSGDTLAEATSYESPDGPCSGKDLCYQSVSFERLKLTNMSTSRPGQVSLMSMQKFQPRVIVEEVTPSEPGERYEIIFPQTSFIAVTAYQNQQITTLKIASNPFAKGFRDSGKPRPPIYPAVPSFPFPATFNPAWRHLPGPPLNVSADRKAADSDDVADINSSFSLQMRELENMCKLKRFQDAEIKAGNHRDFRGDVFYFPQDVTSGSLRNMVNLSTIYRHLEYQYRNHQQHYQYYQHQQYLNHQHQLLQQQQQQQQQFKVEKPLPLAPIDDRAAILQTSKAAQILELSPLVSPFPVPVLLRPLTPHLYPHDEALPASPVKLPSQSSLHPFSFSSGELSPSPAVSPVSRSSSVLSVGGQPQDEGRYLDLHLAPVTP